MIAASQALFGRGEPGGPRCRRRSGRGRRAAARRADGAEGAEVVDLLVAARPGGRARCRPTGDRRGRRLVNNARCDDEARCCEPTSCCTAAGLCSGGASGPSPSRADPVTHGWRLPRCDVRVVRHARHGARFDACLAALRNVSHRPTREERTAELSSQGRSRGLQPRLDLADALASASDVSGGMGNRIEQQSNRRG